MPNKNVTQSLRDLQAEAWRIAEVKGFHTQLVHPNAIDMIARLGLVHTEVSEATQIVKRHWGDNTVDPLMRVNFASELADIVIRVLDIAELADVDLEDAVIAKMEFNANRPLMYNTPLEVAQPIQEGADVIFDIIHEVPNHLRDDAEFIQCDQCGRKSYGGHAEGDKCFMPQPTGERCQGTFHKP